MHVSRVVRAINLRYALGELALIVAGILIALAISDWHDRRLQRANELSLLAEIRTALRTDVAALELDLRRWQETAAQIEALVDVLDATPPYDPAMDALFGALYGQRLTNLNMAAYESLKSAGLQLVSNQELRLGIARVFDHQYERLHMLNDVESQITFGVMRPYYLANFSDIEFLNSATPVDYEAVVADTYYRNIVDYRLVTINANQLAIYAEAITDIRRVLELLDRELHTKGDSDPD